MNNFAHLKKDSPFYPVFPNGLAPIMNWLIAEQGNMIDGGGVQDFYRLDVDKLTPQQFETITKMVSENCHVPAHIVAADMRQRGFIPLRSLHVESTSSDNPAFL